MTLFEELKLRGLVNDISNEKIIDLLNNQKIAFYCGYDPTAKSLQIGNFLAITFMMRLQQHGHKPVVVIGGATGMIGDPSGKSAERNLLSEETLAENIAAQKMQFEKLLKFGTGPSDAIMVNNYDWMGKFSFLEFLRDVGKRFRLSEMLAKDSVKSRLASEAGISFTEFTYQMLQAYDFKFLSQHHNVMLQIGGGDQWGNITAGIELTRKMDAKEVYGLVTPLVTDSTGNKFGKSEGGTTIYLDPEMTSAYQMYQFLLNSDDASVIQYLKYFTFLTLEKIAELEKTVKSNPEKREAQKVLAQEVVKMVHGEAGLQSALKATQIFFGQKIENLKDKELESIFKDVPSIQIEKSILQNGILIADLLAKTPLFTSKGEAKKSLEQKGVYLNNNPIEGLSLNVTTEHLASETCIVIRKGKKNYCLIRAL